MQGRWFWFMISAFAGSRNQQEAGGFDSDVSLPGTFHEPKTRNMRASRAPKNLNYDCEVVVFESGTAYAVPWRPQQVRLNIILGAQQFL